MNERNNNYCTIASKEYILKSLALYDSICRHNNNFHFWICTIDKPSHDLIKKLNLPNTTTIDIASIENNNLLRAKNNRSITEYCWTVKASFIKFIFKQYRKVKSIIYVDADIYLLSEPSLLFQQFEKNDVLLTCHNFSNRFLHLYKQKGKYNAGIIGFRNNAKGLQILSWWEKRCIEWCYDQVTSNRFADQKYLEIIEKRYPKVFIAKPLIVNAAMWNIENCKIESQGKNVLINNDLLVFFHFSSFFIISENEFDIWMWEYPKLEEEVKEIIYLPYVRSILKSIKLIKVQEKDMSKFLMNNYNVDLAGNYIKITD